MVALVCVFTLFARKGLSKNQVSCIAARTILMNHDLYDAIRIQSLNRRTTKTFYRNTRYP